MKYGVFCMKCENERLICNEALPSPNTLPPKA